MKLITLGTVLAAAALCGNAVAVESDEKSEAAELESKLLEAEQRAGIERAGERPATKTRVFPIMKHERSGDSEELELGDVIVGEAYDHQRHGNYSESEFIDLPFVSGVKTERRGADGRGVRVGKVPFVTVFEADHGKDSHSVEVLDVPFFKLAETSKSEAGDVDTKVVKLPIIGSLFRHTRKDGKEKVRFLIFSHTRDIEDGAGNDEAGEPREPIRRSTGKPLPR